MAQDTHIFVNGLIVTVMEVVSLCQHSYSNLRQGQIIDGIGTPMTVERVISDGGFKAYVIQKSGGWRAIVFRGTDDPRDWVFNNHLPPQSSPLRSFPPRPLIQALMPISPILYVKARS